MNTHLSEKLFLLASLACIGVSYFLIKTNTHVRKGGDYYVTHNRLKHVGYLLLFPAGLLLILAVLDRFITAPLNLPDDEQATIFFPRQTTGPLPPITAVPITQSHKMSSLEELDLELSDANALIRADPKSAAAYDERGNIYAEKRSWFQAETDYQRALSLDNKNAGIKFNLVEILFARREYDEAKPGFVALEQDANVGDLASYRAFLCDLYGGHEDAAAKQLDGFNQSGENASYYFANIAWLLFHKKTDEARDWLKSADHIYAPAKVRSYSSNLYQLGYLPLPPQS